MIRKQFASLTRAYEWLESEGYQTCNGGYYFEDKLAHIEFDDQSGIHTVVIKVD